MPMPRLPFEDTFKAAADLQGYTWRNRRWMAWLAFWTMIVAAGLCMFVIPIDRLKALETVITWLMMCCASITGAYMGLSTWASIKDQPTEYPYQTPPPEMVEAEGEDIFLPPEDGDDVIPPTPKKARKLSMRPPRGVE